MTTILLTQIMLLFVIKTVKTEIESYTFGESVVVSLDGTNYSSAAVQKYSALVHEASGL